MMGDCCPGADGVALGASVGAALWPASVGVCDGEGVWATLAVGVALGATLGALCMVIDTKSMIFFRGAFRI